MLNDKTGKVVGWFFYDFTANFADGILADDAILPPTDLTFERDEVPGNSLTLRELLQWAYDNLFSKKEIT